MRIALAQMNSSLGDFAANTRKILDFTQRAQAAGCDLVVFPELSLFGYLPNDLLEREGVVREQLEFLRQVERKAPKGIALLVGCVRKAPVGKAKAGGPAAAAATLPVKPYFNSAALIERGKPTRYFDKERLPMYDVFDEGRHMRPGSSKKNRTKFRGVGLQVTICEDIWGWDVDPQNPLKQVDRRGIELVINLSASPFTKTKLEQRRRVIKQTAAHFRAPMVYVNMVGGQDEVLYDGRSLAVDKTGRVLSELATFAEDFRIFDFTDGKLRAEPDAGAKARTKPSSLAPEERLRLALATGIRDFAAKTGLKRCHLGLSGGIDSAVVACLAVDALGADAVTALTLPSEFNDPRSRQWAEDLAKNLGVRSINLPITPAYETLVSSYAAATGPLSFGILHENLQARIRGLFLMAHANREASLLLATTNKTELSSGYGTLYGDLCGGLLPIGDLLKQEVFALARHYNRGGRLIPNEIIERPPSAELRPNQKDQDSLPSYDELDAAVEAIVVERRAARSKVEKWLLEASYRSEFKRWQSPPILKVSDHSLGRGRRFPIAQAARA